MVTAQDPQSDEVAMAAWLLRQITTDREMSNEMRVALSAIMRDWRNAELGSERHAALTMVARRLCAPYFHRPGWQRHWS